jgi:hypothetical protein
MSTVSKYLIFGAVAVAALHGFVTCASGAESANVYYGQPVPDVASIIANPSGSGPALQSQDNSTSGQSSWKDYLTEKNAMKAGVMVLRALDFIDPVVGGAINVIAPSDTAPPSSDEVPATEVPGTPEDEDTDPLPDPDRTPASDQSNPQSGTPSDSQDNDNSSDHNDDSGNNASSGGNGDHSGEDGDDHPDPEGHDPDGGSS